MKLEITEDNISALLAASKQAATFQNNTPPNPITDDELDDIIGEPDPVILAQRQSDLRAIEKMLAQNKVRRKSLADFPAVTNESDDPNVLIRGAWLERGCGAFLVSTAGTGKSIWMTQFALSMTMGVPFSGLKPYYPLKIWVIQSEDSPRRVAVDREDIIAGLSEDHPEHDWRKAAEKVIFLSMTGSTGATFLKQLRDELSAARNEADLPDVIIINPYMAFMGGDISVNRDNSAFLRGGSINGEKTEGLQSILEDFHVAALIAHHTGKPPSEKEISAWLKNSMPEYQCCGASDITNWGRSFITMMKMPNISNGVMLTAGKNGGGLGWSEVKGAKRIFLAHGDGLSCSGSGNRHYWRSPTNEELVTFREAIGDYGEGQHKPKEPIKMDFACDYITEAIANVGEMNSKALTAFIDEKYSNRTFREKQSLLSDFKGRVLSGKIPQIQLIQLPHNGKVYRFIGEE